MTVIKRPRQQVYGLLGIVISLVLLLFQSAGGGYEMTVGLRRSALFLLGQTDELFGFMRKPRLWLETQNQLRRQVLEYELKVRERDALISSLTAVKRENEDLRASIGKLPQPKIMMSARLLSGGGKFFIDVGAGDGIHAGAVVLARGIFFGTVTDSGERMSTVSSLFDEEIRIGARVDPSGASGILTRRGDYLALTTISRNEEIKPGDKVVTLGDEKVSLPGLLIGYVSQVLTRPADPVSEFIVKPAIEGDQVSGVVVIKE